MSYIYKQLQGRASNGSVVLTNGKYKKLGIQTEPGTIINIDSKNQIMIGITGRLELEEVEITSLSLVKKDESKSYVSYIIDYYKYI